MTDVRDLGASRPNGRRTRQIVFGTVSTEKTAPAAFADSLWVVIPTHSSDHSREFIGGKWPQCHGTTLPVAGDVVIVGYDERNQGHIITWETS